MISFNLKEIFKLFIAQLENTVITTIFELVYSLKTTYSLVIEYRIMYKKYNVPRFVCIQSCK